MTEQLGFSPQREERFNRLKSQRSWSIVLTYDGNAVRVLDVGARGGVVDRVVAENVVARAPVVDPRRVGAEVGEQAD